MEKLSGNLLLLAHLSSLFHTSQHIYYEIITIVDYVYVTFTSSTALSFLLFTRHHLIKI